MRNLCSHIILIILSFSVAVTGAEVWHYPGIGLSVGEASLLTPAGTSLGIDGAISGGYTLRAGHFLIGTGLEMSATRTAFRVADDHHEMPGSVDKDGYEFTFVYDIRGRRDAVTSYQLGVPLRVGAMFNPVYFLVGATLVVPLHAKGDIIADITTYGDYPHFLDPFTSMPEHQYFASAPGRWTDPLKQKIDIRLSAEVGYLHYSMQSKAALAIGLFVNYGMLPHSATEATDGQPTVMGYPALFSDDDMLTPLKANHLLNTAGNKANLLRVGIRLSVIFPHKHKAAGHGPCLCLPFT